MEIINVIDDRLLKVDLEAKDKEEAITKVCELLYKEKYISDVDSFKLDVLKREELGETGIGNGVAIPHGKSSSVIKNTVSICKRKDAIEWESFDGKGVNVVILFAVQDDVESAKEHLKLLASVARKLGRDEVIESLGNAKNEKELKECFR